MFLLMMVALVGGPYDDKAAQACLDKSRTQSEMNLCADQELKRADRALNAEYKCWSRG